MPRSSPRSTRCPERCSPTMAASGGTRRRCDRFRCRGWRRRQPRRDRRRRGDPAGVPVVARVRHRLRRRPHDIRPQRPPHAGLRRARPSRRVRRGGFLETDDAAGRRERDERHLQPDDAAVDAPDTGDVPLRPRPRPDVARHRRRALRLRAGLARLARANLDGSTRRRWSSRARSKRSSLDMRTSSPTFTATRTGTSSTTGRARLIGCVCMCFGSTRR